MDETRDAATVPPRRAAMDGASAARPVGGASRWPLVWALVVGGLLRLFWLGHQPLWLDEAYTWQAAHLLNEHGIRPLGVLDHIGPGYYLIAGGFARVFGYDPVWLRMASALFGIASIWLTHRLVATMRGRRDEANWAAWFIACSPMAVWYSQEARGYSMLLALSTGYLLLTWHQMTRTTLPRLMGLSLLGAAMLWTNQFAVFAFAAMGCFWLLRLWSARRLPSRAIVTERATVRGFAAWLGCHVAAFALFVPWLVLSWTRLHRQLATTETTIWTRIPYNVMSMLAGQTYGASIREIRELGIKSAVTGNLAAFALLGLAVACAALALWRVRHRLEVVQWQWLACVFVVPNVALVAASLVTHNLYHARYLITLLPAIALLFGLFAVRIARDRLALVAVVLSGLVFCWSLANHFFVTKYAKDDSRHVTATLAQLMGPEDSLLVGNSLATPSLMPYGFTCPRTAAVVEGWPALDSLPAQQVTRTDGADTFTVEMRQWESVPSDSLDPALDELLGKPVRTWGWNGVTITQRPGALQYTAAPGLRMGC